MTRLEWLELWDAAKKIEAAISMQALPNVQAIKKNVARIKDLVQREIGQQE